MTSVGSGSLMIILLLFLYPTIGANQLVGTDLTQAVPLTAAAALGALAFGHVDFGVTTSLIIGSVPAVLVGSLLSSSAPDRYIRPVITFVIFASGPEVRRASAPKRSAGSCARRCSRVGVAWLACQAPVALARRRSRRSPATARSRRRFPGLAIAEEPGRPGAE